MAKLSDMLTYLRQRESLTQQELADKLGITRSAIGMYETGNREPDLETLELFADFYNVDMNTLTGHSSIPISPGISSPSKPYKVPLVESEKMPIYLILETIMNERDLTVAKVAKLCNLPDNTVRAILKRKQERVALDVAFKISNGLNVPLERLNDSSGITKSQLSFDEFEHIKKYRVLDVHGKRIVDSVLDLEYDRMTHVVEREEKGWVTYINCYDLAVSAGPGEPWADDSGCKTKIEIPTERVPEKAHYCVRVNGDSMEPAYSDGDIVFVERLEDSVREGEIGIFYLNGSGYMKRLGNQQLISLNPSYDPIPVHDYDDLRCQGRVLGKV